MSNDPFDKYSEVKPRESLSLKILKNSSDRVNPKLAPLSFKYGLIFTFSILFSLFICPQKGVGLFRTDFPFFHHLLHQSEVLCGLYCGLLFFLTTHLLTFFILNRFERIKIIKSYSYLPILFMSGFFGISMTSMFSAAASNANFGYTYNLSWIAVVALSYLILNISYSQNLKKG